MSKSYIEQLANLLQMLQNLDRDLNLVGFNETEKKVFYTVVTLSNNKKKCNISDVIDYSGLSRSSVYKALKKLDATSLIQISQSSDDKREFILNPII